MRSTQHPLPAAACTSTQVHNICHVHAADELNAKFGQAPAAAVGPNTESNAVDKGQPVPRMTKAKEPPFCDREHCTFVQPITLPPPTLPFPFLVSYLLCFRCSVALDQLYCGLALSCVRLQNMAR